MRLSQKCAYALRALLHLARHGDRVPCSIAVIGEQQQIPGQFLQVIMRELRQGGFVASRRGKDGGYTLAKPPRELTLGEVIRFLEGDQAPAEVGEADAAEPSAPFRWVWLEVRDAVDAIYDRVSFADLLDREAARAQDFVI
jgi:Rrf2 family protein